MTMATTFNLSPLIRITLLSLYVSLTVPIPFLADVTQAPVSPALLWVGLGLGAIFLYGALSEKVCLDETGITVTYPTWFRWLTRKGWSLPWEKIDQLKMRTTGQGGLVYYFVTPERDRAYLLPMRVAGFAKMVGLIEAQTNIDTSDVRPLSQPWMYMILLGFTVLLCLVDGWAIATALTLS
ncbi:MULTISPECIES: hypothetical protein [unclassified Picosynechococcus]|nr:MULTISPECIES: hypothetical protein [unclassified Picosynechococcus]ANV88030.1 hypothetical protein AWQ22_11485 [Picosynechococcus sp. PCC 7117]SMH52761.1 hypothetical protein SAMN06272755_2527 [Picosynechococcus sp. OG1]SMQ82415.1 hypothetical protein SAMN06272774_1802 [Synechococcus sp. 7002]